MPNGTSNEQHLSTTAINGVNTVREALLIRVLQEVATRGWALEFCNAGPSWLPRWKRWVNRILKYLGMPFHDGGNERWTKTRHLTEMEREAVWSFLATIVPEPKCRVCGGINLDADPAGYYCHAEDFRGAPLLCLDEAKH